MRKNSKTSPRSGAGQAKIDNHQRLMTVELDQPIAAKGVIALIVSPTQLPRDSAVEVRMNAVERFGRT